MKIMYPAMVRKVWNLTLGQHGYLKMVEYLLAVQKVLTSFFANPSNTVVPALFVINVHNLHAYPVNYGEMSYQGLVVRMKKLSYEIISHEQKGERA